MNIPVDKLLKVRKIIVHDNGDGPCPDGLASAVIIDDVFPGIPIVWAVHGSFNMTPEPNVLFCDFTPSTDLDVWRKLDVIVMDHHKDKEEVVKSFTYHAFGDEKVDLGVSGAVLAYRHVWLPIMGTLHEKPSYAADVERFATLSGIRDTFQRADPRFAEASSLAAALTFYPREMWVGATDPATKHRTSVHPLRRPLLMQERQSVGKIAYEKKLAEATQQAENMFVHTTDKGTRVAIIPTRFITDTSDVIGDRADVAIGFEYRTKNGVPSLGLSCRSRNDKYNVSTFCRTLGGGGHSRAAGASLPVSTHDSEGPFQIILEAWKAYES